MQRWHVTGRRGEFEKLENRCVLAALLPGEAVFPSPRSIIDYGGSVEFDGGRAFVGDIGEDALFVMRRVDGQWQTESVVEPPGQLDFPYAVLARGDVLVAESIDDIDDDATIDLARLYELHDGQWQEKLTVNCGNLPKTLSLQPYQFSCGRNVFVPDENLSWVEDAQKKLPALGDLQGNRLVSSGVVAVYEFQDDSWQAQQTLELRGEAALDGDTIVVASDFDRITFYELQAGEWNEVGLFRFSGHRVWIEGDVAVAASDTTGMVFDRVDGIWQERGEFNLPRNDGHQSIIAIEGEEVLIAGNNEAYILTPALQITGVLWNDLDQDGVRTAGEPRAAGVEVQLLDGNGTIIESTTSNSEGVYDLRAYPRTGESLSVKVVAAPTLTLTQQDSGDDATDSDFDPITQSVNIEGGAGAIRLDAGMWGNAPTTAISGHVWYDDGDGIRETSDVPWAGTYVRLLNDRGWTIAETVTDTLGTYRFDGLAPGSYFIEPTRLVTRSTWGFSGQGTDSTLDSDVDPHTGRSPAIHLLANEQAQVDAGAVPISAPRSLRVTEIRTDYPEYIELTNIGNTAIDLSRVTIRGGIDFNFGGSRQQVLLHGESATVIGGYLPDFAPEMAAGQFERSLGNRELIEVVNGTDVIQSFVYDSEWISMDDQLNNWRPSMSIVDPSAPLVAWNDPTNWQLTPNPMGTPGEFHVDDDWRPGAVVINEVLANPASDEGDWIELRNTTDQPVDISHWFVGDSTREYAAPRRYQIAPGTVIPAGGYFVLNAEEDFDNSNDPGAGRPFGLSRHGEWLYLSVGDAQGNLLGTMDAVELPP
ncbi:MAG: lamin tail domain-containing protein, partial [Planctomycetales bacterium]|nr:lamin tail domain-containing protein [Planctomycetales bacterium]